MLRSTAFAPLCLTAVCVVMLAGCAHEGPLPGQSITRGRNLDVERNQQFVLMDQVLKNKFSFEQPVLREVANGRLEVIVDIRNRTNYNQSVDASMAWRDAQNVVIDETAWTRLIFGANQTVTYRTTSISNQAINFTVRLREGM